MVRQINQNQIWKKKFRFNNSAAVISLIIILFLIISMSGCLEKLNPVSSANNADLNKNITIKKEQPKEILLKSYDDIYVELNNFKKFSETDCINKLTQLQCDNKIEEYVTYIKNNINGHYVEWSGEVIDVSTYNSYLTIVDIEISGFNESEKYQWIAGVKLYGIPKEKLIKFNKGDKISFTGKIMELGKKQGFKGLYNFVVDWKNLELYDVNIEEEE